MVKTMKVKKAAIPKFNAFRYVDQFYTSNFSQYSHKWPDCLACSNSNDLPTDHSDRELAVVAEQQCQSSYAASLH